MHSQKLINIITYGFMVVKSVPSRFFFGTTTRFWAANVVPFFRLLKTPKNYPRTHETLESKGYLKVESTLDLNFWNSLVKKYRTALEDPKKSYLTKNEKTRRLENPLEILGHESINLILNDEKIQEVINGYWGRKFHLKEVNAWRNFPAKTNDYVYSNFWHMDDVSYTSLRIFCYLSDGINKHSGATRITSIPISNKLVKSFKFLHTSIDGNFKGREKFSYSYLDGNIGDVFIFSADRCLHAATAIESQKPRDMLELVIDIH